MLCNINKIYYNNVLCKNMLNKYKKLYIIKLCNNKIYKTDKKVFITISYNNML